MVIVFGDIQWKTLVYNGEAFDKFEISTHGEIRNSITGKIYKTWVNHKGYEQVCVSLGSISKKKVFRIHKAVAETFIPNLDKKPQVNHKDGNKLNNNVTNLEWATNSENMKHAYETGLVDTENMNQINMIPCAKLDLKTGNIIEVFPSLFDAEREIGIYGHICKVCKGDRKSCGGFGWKYLDDDI